LLYTKRPFGEEYQKSPALRNRGKQVTGCSPRLPHLWWEFERYLHDDNYAALLYDEQGLP
jgi:hypothetical protein